MRISFLGLLATAAFATATGSNCVNNNFEDVVSKTPCGCSKKLSRCLGAVSDFDRSDEIQQCFVASGCGQEDAVWGASWFAHECDGPKDLEGQDELRRRQDPQDDTTSAQKTKAGKTTAEKSATEDVGTTTGNVDKTTKSAAAKSSQTAASTTAPSSAAATTTSDNPTSTPGSTTASTPSATTSDSTTASVTAASETTGSTTTPLVCSVTNMVTTSACSVSKGKTITCTPTITPSATCAPGVICQTDDKGNDVCLKKDDHLTTSGAVVAILFIIGIIGAIIAIIIANYQSRAAIRRREVERMALLGGGSYSKNGKGRAVADVEAVQPYASQRNPSEAHVPLMAPGGPRNDQPSYPQQYNNPDEYNRPAGAWNSASPGDRAAPKLHPGLGALGQDYR